MRSLLCLLLLSCSGADCARDPREQTAPLTECAPEQLDIDGCGERFWATCREQRYYCRIDWEVERVDCNEVPW